MTHPHPTTPSRARRESTVAKTNESKLRSESRARSRRKNDFALQQLSTTDERERRSDDGDGEERGSAEQRQINSSSDGTDSYPGRDCRINLERSLEERGSVLSTAGSSFGSEEGNQNQYKEVIAEITALKDSCESIRSALMEPTPLRQRIKEISDDTVYLKEQMEEQREWRSKKNDALTCLKKEYQEALRKEKEHTKELEQQLLCLTKENEHQNRRNILMERIIRAKQNDFEEQEAEKGRLKSTIEIQQEDVHYERVNAESLAEVVNDLETQLEATKDELDDVHRLLNNVSRDLNDANSAKNEYNLTINSLREEGENQRNEIASLQQQNGNLRNETENQSNNIVLLQDQNRNLRNVIEEKEDDIKQLKEEMRKLEKQFQEMWTENHQAISKLEASERKLATENKAMEEELESSKNALDLLRNNGNELEEKNEYLKSEVVNLESVHRAKVTELEEEKRKLKQEKDELEADLLNAYTEIYILREERKNMSQKNEKLMDALQQLVRNATEEEAKETERRTVAFSAPALFASVRRRASSLSLVNPLTAIQNLEFEEFTADVEQV